MTRVVAVTRNLFPWLLEALEALAFLIWGLVLHRGRILEFQGRYLGSLPTQQPESRSSDLSEPQFLQLGEGDVIIHTLQDGSTAHAARHTVVPNKGHCFVPSYMAVVPAA